MNDIDDQHEEIRGKGYGGASIRQGFRDARFSKLLGWVWATLGILALWAVQHASEKLSTLSDDVASIRATLQVRDEKDRQMNAHFEATDHRVDKLEDRVEYQGNKIYQLEGRQLRGMGATKDPNEPR